MQSERIRDLRQYHADVVLKDGSTVHLRPIQPDDEDAWLFLFSRLSPRTIYLRFHHVIAEVTRAEAQAYTNVDYENTFALVAVFGEPPDQRIIAIARFARLANPERAEVAFLVEDSHQGRGISAHLLHHLCIAAREKGVRFFEAEVLAENRDMMKVFRDFGFRIDTRYAEGTYRVVFAIERTEAVEEITELREQAAAIASIRAFFEPQRVAVIGASRERGTIGAEVFHNILSNGFKGVVYPVNPSASVIEGVRAYPSILDVPDDVELAIIAVPAERVLDIADECARKGVRGIAVISAGFKEMGPEGAELERVLLAKARNFGMRLIGPNCLGVLNTDPDVSLNAILAPLLPPRGNVALLSQSGTLGLALLDYAGKLNIGLSSFAGIGNAADVSSNDLVQHWEHDPATSVILLYVESFGNPRRFAHLAGRVSPLKPIVAIKGGRTIAGSRAATSHTGALAGLDVAADALFRQAGVIRTDTLEEMFDVASLLAHQPLPQGRRVAILTNSGGPGILTADACERHGLRVLPANPESREKLKAFLPAVAGLWNPFDLLISATAEHYSRALRVLLKDDEVDSVIVIYVPAPVARPEDVAAAIRDVAAEFEGKKPLLACFMSAQGAPPELRGEGAGNVPAVAFPEVAAVALAHVCEYAEWRRRPRGTVPKLEGLQPEKGRAIVQRALAGHEGESVWLPADACAELLEAYGIRTAKVRLARSAGEAAAAAEEIGFPVVAKVDSTTIAHRTDIGGVVLGLRSGKAVRNAVALMKGRLRAIGRRHEMDGVIIQEMVEGGIEAVVGVTQDPSFGPLIMFGLGGAALELLEDIAVRIHPLTDLGAWGMIREIKGYPLLDGWRGLPPGDILALEDILLRASAMVEDLPEIAEMGLNPVKVLLPGQGCIVVDNHILLRSPAPRA